MKSYSIGFYILLTAACCAAIIFLSLFSEISDIFSGIGSDGIYYHIYIPDLIEHLKNKTFMQEGVEKLLPLTIAHFFYTCFLRAGETVTVISMGDCSLTLSDKFIYTFQLLNTTYLIISVIIWSRICYHLKISNLLFLLSLGLLLFNFMFLKQFFFEPVFLDQFVFFYAMVLLYAVVLDIKWLQYCLIFFSFFVNKLAVVVTFLIIFLNSTDTNRIRINIRRNYLVLLWAISYLSMTLYLQFRPLCLESFENQTMYNVLTLSMLCVIAYTLFLWLKAIPEVIHISISRNILKFIPFAAGILTFTLMMNIFTVDESHMFCAGMDQNVLNMVLSFVRQANSRPLGFLSSHFNYFGFIILLLILFIYRIRKFLDIHPGWIPLFLCFLVISINSESRYLTIFLPFLTWMLIASPDHGHKVFFNSKMALAGVCVLNLVWSGFYRTINPLGTENYFNCKDTIYSNMFIDPLQKYFRHLGPWTCDESYYIQIVIFIGSMVAGYAVIQLLKCKKFH